MKLKPNQKIKDINGNVYMTEANDTVSSLNEQRAFYLSFYDDSITEIEYKELDAHNMYSVEDFFDLIASGKVRSNEEIFCCVHPDDRREMRRYNAYVQMYPELVEGLQESQNYGRILIKNEKGFFETYAYAKTKNDFFDLKSELGLKKPEKTYNDNGSLYIGKDGNEYMTSFDESKIKEAGQLTFDGTVEDEFYDGNKLYKNIYRYLEDRLGKKLDKYTRINLKKLAEDLYDYIIENYGEPLKDENIFDFIDNLFNDAVFIDDFWQPKVLDVIGYALCVEVKELETRYDGDYLLDATDDYVDKEDRIEWGIAKEDIDTDRENHVNSLTTHDLYEWIERNQKHLDSKHMFFVEKTDGYHLSDEFIATRTFDLGEEKSDVPNWFEDFAKNHNNKDDMRYLEDYVADHSYGGLTDRGEPYINYDPFIFNICLKWDDIKDQFYADAVF